MQQEQRKVEKNANLSELKHAGKHELLTGNEFKQMHILCRYMRKLCGFNFDKHTNQMRFVVHYNLIYTMNM